MNRTILREKKASSWADGFVIANVDRVKREEDLPQRIKQMTATIFKNEASLIALVDALLLMDFLQYEANDVGGYDIDDRYFMKAAIEISRQFWMYKHNK